MNLAVVHSSLDELEPGFVVCHRYDEASNKEHAASVADFVAPSATIADYLRSSLLQNFQGHGPSSPSAFRFPDAAEIIDRIQNKLDAIEEQHCSPLTFR